MEPSKSINPYLTEIIEIKGKSYKEVLDLQLSYLNEIVESKKDNTFVSNKLLFVEHNPVFTLGKSGKENNLLVNKDFLKDKGIELFRIERGGDITFHGPGQWVVYPIFDLEKLKIGLRQYIENLEQLLINTCAEHGVTSKQIEGLTGVWVENILDNPSLKKIAAIGVKTTRFVTMHGFALNVNTDLGFFELMNPCGIKDKGVTSLSKETNKSISFIEVQESLFSSFKRTFRLNYLSS
jgi:lipoyl(octanoyl) transferase